MTKTGRKLPADVIEIWPEIFEDVRLNVLPLKYLHAVVISFKDGKVWEIKTTTKDIRRGWEFFEQSLSELLKHYEDAIESIDFKLHTDKIKKDIERSTKKFLKKKKL